MSELLMTEEEICCFDWPQYMPILENQQMIADRKGLKFPDRGIFRFCPWCGEEKNTDHQMPYEKVFEKINSPDAHMSHKMREKTISGE